MWEGWEVNNKDNLHFLSLLGYGIMIWFSELGSKPIISEFKPALQP